MDLMAQTTMYEKQKERFSQIKISTFKGTHLALHKQRFDMSASLIFSTLNCHYIMYTIIIKGVILSSSLSHAQQEMTISTQS